MYLPLSNISVLCTLFGVPLTFYKCFAALPQLLTEWWNIEFRFIKSWFWNTLTKLKNITSAHQNYFNPNKFSIPRVFYPWQRSSPMSGVFGDYIIRNKICVTCMIFGKLDTFWIVTIIKLVNNNCYSIFAPQKQLAMKAIGNCYNKQLNKFVIRLNS